ncbi:adenylyl-sulfate kinase [Paenibacillus sp. BIHB 4019]|uniref:Adenylyl-sulfate kinase n=1 Tax=Paenibacillus sp. BIHB 4019 TaxID=1870819 RepID=A0A1B2DKL1_9BACL|nr:adenylyl-sulfate kinase [Paenibacillus sp. BIHB 4019]ANY68226.1 adenylyl-sulfate kinase [Paenibacillus sp. BIHB 4019]
MNEAGRVYWITGLAGSGKTTIGKQVYTRLKAQSDAVVFLDGDMLREAFGHDLGYSIADRYASAMRNARMCRMLALQGLDVVCATISMFHSCRAWNKANISHYYEIYLRVSKDTLITRNQKELYTGALNGQVQEVVGMDMDFEEPSQPDLIVVNEASASLDAIVNQILKLPE